MEGIDLGTIITFVITIFVAVAGGLWLKAKGKLKTIATLIKETVELVSKAFSIPTKAIAMLDDNVVTKEEIAALKLLFQELKDEAADVKAVWKLLFPGKV